MHCIKLQAQYILSCLLDIHVAIFKLSCRLVQYGLATIKGHYKFQILFSNTL